jgi:hypothetical protein
MRLITAQSHALLQKYGCYVTEVATNVGKSLVRCGSPVGATVACGARENLGMEQRRTHREHTGRAAFP